MHRDEFRAVVSQQTRQALADSGTVVSAIPEAQLQSLINAIADGVFAGFEQAIDEPVASSMRTAASDVSAGETAAVDPSVAAATAVAAAAAQRAAVDAARNDLKAEEKILWKGRPYLTIGTTYVLTTQRLRVIHGIATNQIEEIELVRVRDTKVNQTMSERLFNIGDVSVISGDASTPELLLYNIKDPLDVREMIRKAVFEERERRKMLYLEDIHDEFDDLAEQH
jgi:hypothetical protein